jgi:hypothetical protein
VKLHSAKFESRLRSRVRQIIREDADLRSRRKRAARGTLASHKDFHAFLRVLVSLALGIVVHILSSHPRGGRSVAITVCALWFFLSAIIFRYRILNTFYRIDWLAAFTVLPVPREVVIRWIWDRVTRHSWRTAVDAFAVLAAIALSNSAGVYGWLTMIPFVALLTISVYALALWLVFVPLPEQLRLFPGVAVVGIILICNFPNIREPLVKLFYEHSSTAAMALPAGWILLPYLAGITSSNLKTVVLLIPAIALALSIILARRRLNATYSPFDFALWHVFQVAPVEFREHVNEILAAQPSPPGQTELLDSMKSRAFLARLSELDRGRWIERCFLRWLTAREHAIAELAFYRLPNWTRMSVMGSALFALAITSAAVAKRSESAQVVAASLWISGISGLVASLLALPLTAGFKRAFEAIDVGGITIPFAAVFPVTMREFMRLALKVNLLRSAFIAPIVAFGGAFLGIALKSSPWLFAFAGLKLLLLIVGFTPMLMVMNYSSQSNDTSKITLRGLSVIVGFVVGAFGFIGFGIAAVLASLPWSIVWLSIAIGMPAGVAGFYLKVHGRRPFDLMTLKKD